MTDTVGIMRQATLSWNITELQASLSHHQNAQVDHSFIYLLEGYCEVHICCSMASVTCAARCHLGQIFQPLSPEASAAAFLPRMLRLGVQGGLGGNRPGQSG